MGSQEISVDELVEAEKKFEADFDSTKMHRFPAGLRGMGDEYINPMVVAIGPCHHGALRLQKKEEVKCAAANYFISLMEEDKLPEEIYKEACRSYADDEMVGWEDADFQKMMFLDACFLVLYMLVFSRRFSEKLHVNSSLRRFLFSYRGSINNDIMLLENLLPWTVVMAVKDSLLPEGRSSLMESVGNFIAGMGDTFKIRQDAKKEPRLDGKKEPFVWDKCVNNRSPPHLLGLFRRHKTEPGNQIKWPHELNHISASSAIELAEIGMKLTPSNSPAFTDMKVKKKWILCGELSLAPLSLNDTRAHCLVNMAAFDVSTGSSYGDDPNSRAVCSYLALFAMLMAREEDVHELRSKRILHGDHTNMEMLAFFKKAVNHLPDSGCHFSHIMAHIVDYKKRSMRTKVDKFFYINCGAIIQVLTIVSVLGGLFKLLSLNQSHRK